jgi:hypothetical protein
MADELLTWMQMLARHRPARTREPKSLRLRLFSAAGRLVPGSRRLPCTSPPFGPGPPSSVPRLPTCRPTLLADQPEPPLRPGRKTQGPWNPPTRRDNREARHGQTLKTATGRSLTRTYQDRKTSRPESTCRS